MIRANRELDAFVIALDGELDLASAPLLTKQLRAARDSPVRRVVVDLGGLHFIGSTGLHVLLDAHRRFLQNGQRLFLVRGPSAVHRVFELTRTVSLFEFES